MKSVVFLCMSALIMGCASNQMVAQVPVPPPQPMVWAVHADTSFSLVQRAHIYDGMERIKNDTHGILNIEVVFDFDWGDEESVVKHRYDNALLSVNEDHPMVYALDKREHAHIRAWTSPEDPRRSFMVRERIEDAQFERDVMHEILHQCGLHDILNRNSIMSLESNATTCFTSEDAEEFCRAFMCDAKRDVDTCDSRGKSYQP